MSGARQKGQKAWYQKPFLFGIFWYHLAIILLGIILVTVYLLGKSNVKADEPVSIWFLLSKEIGMALMIAIIVVYAVELITRHKHEERAEQSINSIKQNIFQGVFSRYIPESVFKEVEDCLLYSNLSRTDYKIQVNLAPLDLQQESPPKSEEHYIAEYYSSYELVNNSEQDIKEMVRFDVEVPNEPQYESLTQITLFKVNDEEHVTKAKPIRTENGRCLYETEVTIPGDGKVSVVMTGCTVKRKIDHEIWLVLYPTDGVHLTINPPPDLDVKVKASNSKDIERENPDAVGSQIWSLKSGIFPHQSVIMWWNGYSQGDSSEASGENGVPDGQATEGGAPSEGR